MLGLIKVIVGLIFGGVTFILPLPMGGERLFGIAGRAVVLLGIIAGLLVYFRGGKRRLSDQFRKWPRLAYACLLLLVVALGAYLLPWYFVQSPCTAIIILELVAYSVFAFIVSFALAILGALFVEWKAKRDKTQ